MVGLTILQPQSAHVGIAYYIIIVAAIRLDTVPGIIVSAVVVVAECITLGFVADPPAGAIIGSGRVDRPVVPRDAPGRPTARGARAGRGADGGAARVARGGGRVGGAGGARPGGPRHARRARALAVGVGLAARGDAAAGARPRRRSRGRRGGRARAPAGRAKGWPRRATRSPRCAARRCPGRSGWSTSPTAFTGDAAVTVCGTPRELESEARLAIYRTAQEALTNVLRHSAADRVDVAAVVRGRRCAAGACRTTGRARP